MGETGSDCRNVSLLSGAGFEAMGLTSRDSCCGVYSAGYLLR